MTAPTTPPVLSGPTSRFQLNDPTTIGLIVSAVTAVATQAVPAIANWHVNEYHSAIVTVILGLIVIAGIVSKHGLKGRERIAEAISEAAKVWGQVQPELPTGALTEVHTVEARYEPVVEAVKPLVTDLFDQGPAVPALPQAAPAAPVLLPPNNRT